MQDVYPKYYPKQTALANKIIDLIKQNDIFTPEGHRIVMQAITEIVKIDKLVKLVNLE